MTKEKNRQALIKILPKMKKTRKWLLSEIAYEEHKGVHTYHLCQYCKKNSTRSGKCGECLRKDLRDKKENSK